MSKRAADTDEGGAFKRLKSDANGSTVASSSSALTNEALIAQRRAEIAAKMASFNAMRSGGGAAAPPIKPTLPATAAAAPSRSTAVPSPASAAAATTASSEPPAGLSMNISDIARKVAEAKKLVASSMANKAVKDNPYLSVPKKKSGTPSEAVPQGAGLKMAAHPLLLDATPIAPQSKKDRYKPMQPKFASIKANARNIQTPTPPPPIVPTVPIEKTANPYAASLPIEASGFEGAAPKERTGRGFRFNQKGKYVQLGNQMRQEAQLEALKQRIAESAKKAGLDSEFETLEKNIRRDPPPDAEWWDAPLLPNKTYADLDNGGLSNTKIRGDDTPIGPYVQHPIPIPAPWDKNKVDFKPLKLTKKEQKKMRKQRRQAELQDKQDRVRMGLIPPDPPKVRLANLMKVLTTDAVQDPTKIENRVRREVAMRRKTHEKMNEERKLTDEQRREKIELKKAEEEKKGVFGAAFKIKTLSDPSHRFKIRKNAEQMGLTGMCIFNPSFNLVVVEGSMKGIKQYSRLMLVRMNWTEAARARNTSDDEEDGEGEEGAQPKPSTSAVPQQTDEEAAQSLKDNKCEKVWEGPLRDRAFKGFKARTAPNDTLAREALGGKWAMQWDVAKTFVSEELL